VHLMFPVNLVMDQIICSA